MPLDQNLETQVSGETAVRAYREKADAAIIAYAAEPKNFKQYPHVSSERDCECLLVSLEQFSDDLPDPQKILWVEDLFRVLAITYASHDDNGEHVLQALYALRGKLPSGTTQAAASLCKEKARDFYISYSDCTREDFSDLLFIGANISAEGQRVAYVKEMADDFIRDRDTVSLSIEERFGILCTVAGEALSLPEKTKVWGVLKEYIQKDVIDGLVDPDTDDPDAEGFSAIGMIEVLSDFAQEMHGNAKSRAWSDIKELAFSMTAKDHLVVPVVQELIDVHAALLPGADPKEAKAQLSSKVMENYAVAMPYAIEEAKFEIKCLSNEHTLEELKIDRDYMQHPALARQRKQFLDDPVYAIADRISQTFNLLSLARDDEHVRSYQKDGRHVVVFNTIRNEAGAPLVSIKPGEKAGRQHADFADELMRKFNAMVDVCDRETMGEYIDAALEWQGLIAEFTSVAPYKGKESVTPAAKSPGIFSKAYWQNLWLFNHS